MEIKLTQFSNGSGCGCKIAPEQLKQILKTSLDIKANSNLLVGYHTNDDAAVYDIGNSQAVISTTDFFLPIVDDAADFGKIAATNAISDVYAMGGKPIMAVAILGWPMDKIDHSLASAVLDGARHICAEANIPLAGGHSIESSDPIFGLAVTGLVSTKQIKRNNTALEGDFLFLTKPIGVGILAAAFKRNILLPEHYQLMIDITTTLNKAGTLLASIDGVNAMTDVTGFGLLGHLTEMMIGSNLSANLFIDKVGTVDQITHYTNQFCYPNITTKNYNAYKSTTKGLDGIEFITLCDPQTSGGLLVSVAPNALEEYKKIIAPFDKFGIATIQIGQVTHKKDWTVILDK